MTSAYGPWLDIHVVTGILGSGKTTVLCHLLDVPTGERVAVVVGEYAERGLDGDLLRQSGADVIQITATGRGQDAKSYLEPVRELVRRRLYRRIFLETSGVTQISEVARDLMNDDEIRAGARLGRSTTVVDCGAFTAHDTHFNRQLWAQIGIADVVVLNKTDKVPQEDTLGALRDRVKAQQPDADVVFAYMGQIRSVRVIGEPPEDFRPALLDVDWSDDPPAEFESFVYRSDKVCFDRPMFGHKLLNLPGGRVARFKGVLKSYDRTHVVNGLPGQLDWGVGVARGETAIAFIGLGLEARKDDICAVLDAELLRQQDDGR